MNETPTTLAVQQYLDELVGVAGDSPAEPIVRNLLARSVRRLELLCRKLLVRGYPRLTKAPVNLEPEELLGAVVERLLKAMREARPTNVRQFFALANQHVRWELNDLARRLVAYRQEVISHGIGFLVRDSLEELSRGWRIAGAATAR